MNLDSFLYKVSRTIAGHFKSDLGLCDIHPGMLSSKDQSNLKNYSPVIYTTITDVLSVAKEDNGWVKNVVQVFSLLLVYNRTATERDAKIRNLMFRMTHLLTGQKWKLDYTWNPQEIKAFDLHGLLRKPGEVMGTQAWNPTLQARANDLFGELDIDKDPQFSIWGITWEQNLVHFPDEEPESPFQFPDKVQMTDMLDTALPDVLQLKLKDWSMEEVGEQGRILKGTVQIKAPGKNAALITSYKLFWGNDSGARLDQTRRIAEWPAKDKQEFKLPSDLKVPRGATCLLVIGFSQSGFSPKPAWVKISGFWRNAGTLAKARARHFVLCSNNVPVVLGGTTGADIPVLTPEYHPAIKKTPVPGEMPAEVKQILGVGVTQKQGIALANTSTATQLYSYTASSDTWEKLLSPLPENTKIIAGALAGNIFCVISSNAEGYSKGLFTCPLPTTKNKTPQWQSSEDKGGMELAPKAPPFERKQFALCSTFNQLFVVGGSNQNTLYTDQTGVYNCSLRKWTALPDMPVALRDTCAWADHDKLYVFGGATNQQEASALVFYFDFQTETWHGLPPLNTGRRAAQAMRHNGNIHVFGGFDANGKALDSNEIYL